MELMQIPFVHFANQLSRVIIPIIIIIGVVSNSLNIVVLTRPKLYRQACSHYFLANAGSNLFYLSVILIYDLLATQYGIDAAKVSVFWCKMITYIIHVCIFLTPNFIILASIDRWCASSTSPQLRKLNNVKIARWLIFFTTVLFALFFINSIIMVDLRKTDPFGCRIRADTVYKGIYVFVQASMVAIIPPCLLTLFGLMTIYNIKKAPVIPIAISRGRRTANQLARMLLLQIGTYIILTVPSSAIYLIYVLPNNIDGTPDFIFASMLSLLSFHASYATPFFLYVLSGQVYRKEFIRLGTRIFRPNRRIQVHPLTDVNNTIPMAHRLNTQKHNPIP